MMASLIPVRYPLNTHALPARLHCPGAKHTPEIPTDAIFLSESAGLF